LLKKNVIQGLSALLLLLVVVYLTVTKEGNSEREVLTFAQPTAIADNAQLHIQGRNHAVEPRTLVIRIDDRKNPVYAQRVNLERTLPAGVFDLQLSLAGLHTPSGRKLKLNDLHQIIAFAGNDSSDLHIEAIKIYRPAALPDGVSGWDLGPAGSALWPGFSALTPDNVAFHGKQLIKAIDRGSRKQATEGLTSDGIRGIKELRLPLANGRWSITLWLRDPGEWEHLPHPLNRRLLANGREVWSQQYSSEDWIKQVYLAGRSREVTATDDAWSLFGERADGRISFLADVSNNELRLAFYGEQPDAGFVAAILAEPGKNFENRDRVEKQRAAWWRNNWRLGNWPQLAVSNAALIPLQQNVIAAAGTTSNLRFDLTLNESSTTPVVHLEAPALGRFQLKTELRWGQWRLKRSANSATLLTLSNRYLRGGAIPQQNVSSLPRRLHLTVDVPEQAPAGLYLGRISVIDGKSEFQQTLKVIVPEVRLPAADRPIGVYLERPVHFDWFDESHALSTQAMRCDMRFLNRLGMSGIAPPLTTPDTKENVARFIEEIRLSSESGFLSPVLAYSPFKRLQRSFGIEGALSRIVDVEDRLNQENLPLPVWATADEPSNQGQNNSVDKIRRYASAMTPATQLAGQLNNASDVDFLGAFDIVLINPGYGIDEDDIRTIKDKGVTPWLYNVNNHRAAAGFYLWRIQAQGYLQWHARMPTADPFDPTDGREDDAQFLLPMAKPCPLVKDVDTRVFEISEGITDLRWLLWLESQAENEPRALELLEQLRGEIPTIFSDKDEFSTAQLNEWRLTITNLAQQSVFLSP
jgi:hypothetical protein